MSENDGLPTSEDLDRFAEEQQIADATREAIEDTVNSVNNSVPTLCSCGAPRQASQTFCYHCGQDFSVPATAREPLTEEDGTTHQGARVRLIGEGWPNELKTIKDCTDEELELQISGLQKLLTRAIQTQDYAQISIAAREFELGYRKHSRYVSAMRRREKLQQGVLRLNSKQHRVAAKSLTMEEQLAKQLGIPIEQAKALKIILDAQKKS